MSRNPYKQGIFRPLNPNKYKGTYPIIYRSGLELSFMKWVDNNNTILEWGSESVVIPYVKPNPEGKNKIHKYYVDFNATIKTDTGFKRYLIEVKPFKQTQPPKYKGKNILYENFQWAVNSAKWAAAQKWCEKNNHKFLILTEKDLK
jgi:hypothetical protein